MCELSCNNSKRLLRNGKKLGDTFLPHTVGNIGLLGGVMVRASDLRSSSLGFDSRPGRYRAT